MLFNSWGYILVFIAVAVPLHWALPHRHRIGLLGVGSLLFYGMWRWEFVGLMALSAAFDFVSGHQIAKSDDPRVRKAWLMADLAANLGLLIGFKYTYFIYDNVSFIGSAAGVHLPALQDLGIRIILPLGISFYTFQTISYTIDVYRRVTTPTTDFWLFLTYVTFWPQLIAGPILRVDEVLPQLASPRTVTRDQLATGLLRVLIGLFKKVVLADTIGESVDAIFVIEPSRLAAFDVWAGTCLFGFQIYFDFAGYSDIAIGTARLLGFDFPENFSWPYLATSPREFWRRWHISLSSWIRDYLYLPLAGQPFGARSISVGGMEVAAKDVSTPRRDRALFLSWLIMGLWHGAGWNFAIWGLYHAVIVYSFRVVPPLRALAGRAPKIAWVVTFLAMMIGWLPFRCTSLPQLVGMAAAVLDPRRYDFTRRVVGGDDYLLIVTLVLGMLLASGLRTIAGKRSVPRPLVLGVNMVGVSAMVFLVLAFFRPVRQFIYFQF